MNLLTVGQESSHVELVEGLEEDPKYASQLDWKLLKIPGTQFRMKLTATL